MEHLSGQFDELRDLVAKAVLLADNDTEMALTRIRKVLEWLIKDAYQRLVKSPPGTQPLENLLQRLLKDGHLPLHLAPYTTFIRELGNAGAHHPEGQHTVLDVNVSLIQLRAILDWYFQTVRPDAAAVSETPDPSRASVELPKPVGGGSRVDPFVGSRLTGDKPAKTKANPQSELQRDRLREFQVPESPKETLPDVARSQ